MISMKNNKIIDSWNKIEPSASANVRMLSAIIEQNRFAHNKKGKAKLMSKRTNLKKRIMPAAACFAVLAAVISIIGVKFNWFEPRAYTFNLGDGETVVYHKADTSGTSFAQSDLDFGFNVESRELTASELRAIFPNVNGLAEANGMFNTSANELVRVEGEIGETKVILAKAGIPVTDVIIEGNESVSIVEGTPVTAGYFITDANSKGVRTIIYFASFDLGNVSVYAELAGSAEDSDNIGKTISDVIFRLIKNGEPDFTAVTK